MSPLLLMNSLSNWVNGPKAAGLAFTINWRIAKNGGKCHSELSNAVLINLEGLDPEALLNVCLPRQMLSAFALGHITVADIQGSDVRIEGDETILSCLENLLNDFPAWFPITTHDSKFGEKNL